MGLIIFVVFVSVFILVALLIVAARANSASPEARATLASALKSSFSVKEEEVDVRKNYSLSSIPWIHRLLERIDAAVELRLVLDQADLQWTPAQLVLTAMAVWVISSYAIHLRTGLGALSVALGLPLAGVPFVVVWRKRQARFNRFLKALPDALDLMVSALRAGHSMIGALGIVASEAPEPIRREFKLCFEEQNFGVDLRAAMDNLLRRVPLQDLRIIATAILIQKESGGNLAEVLEKTGKLVRDRFRLLAQIRVHTTQSRLTGNVLAAMPFIMASLLYADNPAYMMILFTRPLGHTIMSIGAGLNLLGLLAIRKIGNIKV